MSFADAEGYELLMGRWSALLGREFVRFVALPTHASVLDVGCGTGSLSAAILEGVPGSRVTGIDPSPEFVEKTSARLQTPRARFEIGDATRLSFPDAIFDASLACLVLNFVPDSALAVAEMKRVTKAGGRVGACVWDYSGGMTMLRAFWDAAVALDRGAASRHERRMALGHEGDIDRLLEPLGLADLRRSPLEIEMRFSSFRDFWSPFLSGAGPSGAYVSSLPPGRRDALEERLLRDLWKGDASAPHTLPARAWAVVGRVRE